MNTTNTMTGYIYVRQHDFSDKYDLYRISKSKNIINTEIENISMETIILNYLKSNNNYIQAKEYGNEYFICDLKILIDDIHTLVQNN